jgi:hypothetical protein
MFRHILTSFCICLQGTVFQRGPRKRAVKERQEHWYYSVDQEEQDNKPYLMVAEEFKIKYDLITKMHTRDGHLLSGRDASNRGRAKWNPEKHEQVYQMVNEPGGADPRVEVYYQALGLGQTREQHNI